jgi:c-di-AMP phosphodiesterase-like protein
MYNDSLFLKTALHRKLKVFDPSTSDNPMVTQAIYESSISRDTGSTIHKLMNHELERYESMTFSTLPMSYILIHHRLHNAWIDLIHQMIFRDNMYGVFVGEFKDVITNIILSDSPDNLESAVYRYKDGESIFHMAARVWVLSELHEMRGLTMGTEQKKEKIHDILTYILLCYQKIGECMEDVGDEFCITDIEDFNGIPLDYSLNEFIDILPNG